MSEFRRPIVAFTSAGPSDPSVRTWLTAWAQRTGTPLDLRVGGALRPSCFNFRSVDGEKDPVVIVLRNSHKTSTGRSEQALLGKAGLGIYELDDGLPWDNGRLDGLGRWWKVPFRRDRIAFRAAKAADRVIAGNEVLAEWAAQHCVDVRLIPTCVEPNDYDRKTHYEIDRVPQLIWIGSSATEFELHRIAPALALVHRETGAQLTVLGAPGQTLPSEMQPFTRRIPWSSDAQRVEIATADIGLMPLGDGVYQRAKCGYKLLQYAAAALPAVASPIGVNAHMLSAGLGVATSDYEWVDNLVSLITAPASDRRKLGESAYRACTDNYSYGAGNHSGRWLPIERAPSRAVDSCCGSARSSTIRQIGAADRNSLQQPDGYRKWISSLRLVGSPNDAVELAWRTDARQPRPRCCLQYGPCRLCD